MVAGIIMVVILVIVIPVGFLMSTSIVAAIIGHLLQSNADAEHEGSELIATSD